MSESLFDFLDEREDGDESDTRDVSDEDSLRKRKEGEESVDQPGDSADVFEVLDRVEDVTSEIDDERGLREKIKDVLNRVKMGVGEKILRIRAVGRAMGEFYKDNSYELKRLWGKTPEERGRRTMILGFLGLVVICGAASYLQTRYGEDGLGDFLDEEDDLFNEGEGEPGYEHYKEVALGSWGKYKRQGPIEGAMLDPMAIDNSETRLVTGYYPGWFCVPERVEICEKMLGVDIESQLPEKDLDRDLFFIKMQAEWDEKWLPKLLANPDLPDEVKEFYKPGNRGRLRNWFREKHPVGSNSFDGLRRSVADEMFVGFLETGKLTPKKVDFLRYSHLAGSFVASVLTAWAPINLPMTETGFVAEKGGQEMDSGLLPAKEREAYRQMKTVMKKENYTLLDIAPYVKVINQYTAEEEKSRGLKPKALGRL